MKVRVRDPLSKAGIFEETIFVVSVLENNNKI